MMAKETVTHYVDNKRLYTELKRWRSTEEQRLPIYVAQCILAMVDRQAALPCYSGYSYLEDMRQRALLDCVEAAPKFDPERSNNPNAFFWSTIRRAFKLFIWREQTERAAREHYKAPEAAYEGDPVERFLLCDPTRRFRSTEELREHLRMPEWIIKIHLRRIARKLKLDSWTDLLAAEAECLKTKTTA